MNDVTYKNFSSHLNSHIRKQLNKTTMKTTKWIFTILATFIVAIGFAAKTEAPKMNVIRVETEKALVAFDAKAPTMIELSITNYRNNVVYYYKSEDKQMSYRGKFDFSRLENGVYNVSLNYGNQSLNSEVYVSNKGLDIKPTINLYEPFFDYDNDKLNVSFLNVPKKQVYLNIYKNKEHIAGAKLGKDFAIHKCLDFSKLEEGEYQVVITDFFNDHTYMVSK